MASLNLGQKNLPVGAFTVGPLTVAANEMGISHTWNKVSWTNDGGGVLTYQMQYSLDGTNWNSFTPVITITAIAIPSKFKLPTEQITLGMTVPGFGQTRQVRAQLNILRACTLKISAQTK